MMLVNLKGVFMFKTLVVLACAGLLLPAWAQNQGRPGAKTQSPQPYAQAKVRAAADLTARLQARAIAEAAAQSAALAKASIPTDAQLSASAPPVNPVPALLTATQPTQAEAAALMQSQTPVPAGLAVTDPVGQSASDVVSQDLAIARQIHQGLMPCEMGASVRVEADAAAPGYFHVQGKGFRYRMYPVRTSTGALRLEDKKAGAVWLQLANKSMLMDQKKGRRMADECAHPEQVAYGQDMKTNPPPSLFDKTGMGRSND